MVSYGLHSLPWPLHNHGHDIAELYDLLLEFKVLLVSTVCHGVSRKA